MAACYEKYQRRPYWYDGITARSAGPEDLTPYLVGAAARIDAWIKVLETLQYRVEIVPVEFAEYDQDL